MATKKPVVLVVMDGVGFSVTGLGDAVTEANTPTLDMLLKEYPNTSLKAHGDATGNQLVGYLAGKVEVRAFAEQIPSMNDIFLQLIGKDAQWADEQIENRQQSKAEESVNPSSNL